MRKLLDTTKARIFGQNWEYGPGMNIPLRLVKDGITYSIIEHHTSYPLFELASWEENSKTWEENGETKIIEFALTPSQLIKKVIELDCKPNKVFREHLKRRRTFFESYIKNDTQAPERVPTGLTYRV
jgi:hypothetical protein